MHSVTPRACKVAANAKPCATPPWPLAFMCVECRFCHLLALLAFACPCARCSLSWGPVSHPRFSRCISCAVAITSIRCWQPARADGTPRLRLFSAPATSALPRRLKSSTGLFRERSASCSTANDRRRPSAPRCRECVGISSRTGQPGAAIYKRQQRVDGRGCQQTARELRQALRRPVVLLLCVPTMRNP